MRGQERQHGQFALAVHPLGQLSGVAAATNFLQRSRNVGERLTAALKVMATRHACIGDVRGLGAMVAVELFKNGDVKQPDSDLAKRITVEATTRGLILLTCGTHGNVIRILVPLTASDALLDEGLAIMAACFDAVA